MLHIGSQLTDLTPFELAVPEGCELTEQLRRRAYHRRLIWRGSGHPV